MSEIVFTGTGDSAHDQAVRYRAKLYQGLGEVKRRFDKTGQPLRKLAERVYTTNLVEGPDKIMVRNAWLILGTLFAGHVISGKSAAAARVIRQEGDPSAPGFVFLTGSYRRNVSLPGLEIRIAEGPPAFSTDIPFMGLYLASPARHCLENLMPSRDRGGVSRTTGREEVERFLAQRCQVAGEVALNELRDEARAIKDSLGAQKQFDELNGIIGALLNSRDAGLLKTEQGKALSAGEPFDQACAERLNALFSYLASNSMPNRRDEGLGREASVNTAFMEAYFSNYIEGTTFLVPEAEDIVFNGVIPQSRPKDGHDILGTFRQLADYSGLKKTPRNADDFIRAVQERHALLMGARPEVSPGEFKTKVNRAGNTVFVHPDQVQGTLRFGFDILQGLREPFARAVFVHFLVSEVHPFSDGNGRLARIMMANELTAGGLARAVIPTVYRDDYIGGQRAMSRFNDAGANFRAIDRAQAVTASIVEDDRRTCIERWASTNAFMEPGANATLADPDPAAEIEWRDGMPAPSSYWEARDNSSRHGM